MKRIIIYICLLSFILSCNKTMDEINTDPDRPATVPARYLATNAILSVTGNNTGKNFLNDGWVVKTIASNELSQSEMYNSFSSSSINYTILTNTLKMVEAAELTTSFSEDEKKSYRALNHFIKAWIFYETSMALGNVPCSDALKGEEGVRKVKYDTQEEVFSTIISLLDQASVLFSSCAKFDGDPIYKGDPELWEKTANSFLLRVLIQLSEKKTTVGDYNVRQKFEEVAKRPLYESSDEDFRRTYSNKGGQYYPFSKQNHNYITNMFLQKFFVDMLTGYQDYRLFYLAEPAVQLIEAGHREDEFGAYSGVDGTQAFATVEKETLAGQHSKLNLRYSEDPVCEPVMKLSFAEIQFILAEAAEKGWTTPQTAEVYYNAGVTASMKFTAAYTQSAFRHNVVIDDAYITSYLQTTASYVNATDKRKLILEQKFIASFMQTKWNTYYDYRRTGLPELPINPETSMNVDAKDKMPVRWTYPSTEYSSNYDNLEAAIKQQFGETVETQNDIMWLLK